MMVRRLHPFCGGRIGPGPAFPHLSVCWSMKRPDCSSASAPHWRYRNVSIFPLPLEIRVRPARINPVQRHALWAQCGRDRTMMFPPVSHTSKARRVLNAVTAALCAARARSHRPLAAPLNNPLFTCAPFWESDCEHGRAFPMKRMILMRHAKSDWSVNGDDHARPLNARGTKSAPAMGDWLRDKGWVPDEILCSTATRTRQTLDLLKLGEVPTRFERSLYLAEAETIMSTLRAASGDTVLLLAHNHGIAECAHRLVGNWPDHSRFIDYPTCATSLISFDIDAWSDMVVGQGVCEDFAIPRELMSEQSAG